VRAALNAVMAASLRPVSVVFTILFTVLAASHALVLSSPVAEPMTLLAAGTAVSFLSLYLVLGWRAASDAWAHPLGAGMAALVLLNCLLPLTLLFEPIQTTNLMLFLVGVGCLFLSTPWFALVVSMTLLGWGSIEWSASPSPAWRHFGFGLLSATALAVVVHTVRMRTFHRLAQLRFQEAQRQHELQEALSFVQQAEEASQAARDQLEAHVRERTMDLVAANAALRAEITDRQRAEHALRESEEQYRDLVENINDIIYTHDAQGYLTYISPVVTLMGGYHPSELIGHSISEFIHPDDLPAILASSQRTLAGKLEPSEFRVRTKTGGVRWVRSSSQPIMQQGLPVGLRGVITDITARKRAENQAQVLLAVAEDISGTLELQQLLERVQRRAAEVLPCDIVSTFYWDPQRATFRLLSQHGLPAALLSDAEALAFAPNEPFGGRVANGQTVVLNEMPAPSNALTKVLSYFHVTALVATPLRVRGRHLGALVACTTTSGSQFDEAQVELCNGIAHQLAVGIEATELYKQQQEEAEAAAVVARVGQEMMASLHTPMVLQHLCRLTAEALAGRRSCIVGWRPEHGHYAVLAHWGFSEEHQLLLDALTFPEQAVADLVTLLQTDEVAGIQHPVPRTLLPQALLEQCQLETAIFVRLQHGQEVLGFQICDVPDPQGSLTSRDRIARGLAHTAALVLVNAKLLEELERANRVKEEFVGLMSHELRTPLGVIIGYTQLLMEDTFGTLTVEQADVLRRISKNTKELLDLVNATLDLSRVQNQQRFSLSIQKIGGAALLAELESEMRQLQRKPSVRMQWQIAPRLPTLHTDVMKLKMVLKNIITNALKFTDAGVITIGAQPRQNGVDFEVADTGIGIPQDALGAIFEPFRQVDSSSTRRHGGVGLGLYIVRQLVGLLGGMVTVESEVGRGSTFRVWIPAETPVQNSLPAHESV
jgi:PAS domain S-box-containing protein